MAVRRWTPGPNDVVGGMVDEAQAPPDEPPCMRCNMNPGYILVAPLTSPWPRLRLLAPLTIVRMCGVCARWYGNANVFFVNLRTGAFSMPKVPLTLQEALQAGPHDGTVWTQRGRSA